MFLTGHVIASGIASGVVYAISRNSMSALLVFGAGVFTDLDHIIDYFLETRKWINLRRFFWMSAVAGYRKLTLVFHSWELVPMLIGLGIMLKQYEVFFSIAGGLLFHLIVDQISNPVFWNSYFFTHRLRYGFRIEAFISKTNPEVMSRRQRAIEKYKMYGFTSPVLAEVSQNTAQSDSSEIVSGFQKEL